MKKKLRASTGLDVIVAQRPDNGVVVVALNKGKKDVKLRLEDGRLGRGSFVATVPARSIQTFVWW